VHSVFREVFGIDGGGRGRGIVVEIKRLLRREFEVVIYSLLEFSITTDWCVFRRLPDCGA